MRENGMQKGEMQGPQQVQAWSGKDTSSLKTLLTALTLSVSTRAAMPVVASMVSCLDSVKSFGDLSDRSADWGWIRWHFVFLAPDLSLMKSWAIQILSANFSLTATEWATSPALVSSTEAIGSKSLHGMSHVLEMILGEPNRQAAKSPAGGLWLREVPEN